MTVISRTLERLRDHLGLDIAYIAELDGDDMIVRAYCAPDFPAELPDQMTLPRKAGFCHYMMLGEIPQIIQDSAQHPVTRDLPARHEFNIQSYLGIPLERADGSIYGSICCLGHQPNKSLNDRDLRSIKLFAEIVAEQIDGELEDRRKMNERFTRIETAIQNEAFEVFFQPIVHLKDGRLRGFETLSRFKQIPYRSPDIWFAEADHVGLGIEAELAVIRKALDLASAFPKDVSLSLNVSPDCLMSEDLADACFPHIADRTFVLEVTEHTAVPDYKKLIKRLKLLKQNGLKIAVDDAGAGYSSLNHIVQLQPDLIKLDMSLTRKIDRDPIRRSLANALVHFSKEIGAQIVAEGIETLPEHKALSELGAHFGQGYFYARPMPLCDVETYLSQAHQRHLSAAANARLI